METRTRGKGTIDCRLRESVGTLANANPTRLFKRSQAVPLQNLSLPNPQRPIGQVENEGLHTVIWRTLLMPCLGIGLVL